jgi:hypothetical protein
MKARDIDLFFEDLSRRIDRPVRVLLTGGAAGILQGMKRATFDIDFEIRLKTTGKAFAADAWERLHRAIDETARATGITPQYAEDIAGWSLIALPAKRSSLYRKFAGVEVRILEPALWAVGKLTRYLSTDVQDLRTVLKHTATDPKVAVRTWGTALGKSPASSSQTTFRKQVEAFLDQYAREIWGAGAEKNELKQLFLHSAQKARAKKSGSGR